MKYIGMALMAAAALLMLLYYKRSLRDRIEVLSAVLALVGHISERVSVYLEPPTVWARGFTTGNPRVDGFTERVALGESLTSAYTASDGLSLSGEARELADGFFRALGGADIGEIRRSIERTGKALDALVAQERKKTEEKMRVGAAFTFALAAGGIILII